MESAIFSTLHHALLFIVSYSGYICHGMEPQVLYIEEGLTPGGILTISFMDVQF